MYCKNKEYFLKYFKGSTQAIYFGVAMKYHIKVGMVDTIGMFWFLGVGCASRDHTQYKWRLEKEWERPTKRAIMAIIMHSDKTY